MPSLNPVNRPLVNTVFFREDKFLDALAEAYRLQEAIISSTELSIISTDPNGLITSYNEAAEALLGYTAEEMIGKETLILFHDVDEVLLLANDYSQKYGVPSEPVFDVFTAHARIAKAADRRKWTYIHKDGNRIKVLVSITSLWDHDQLMGYAAVAFPTPDNADAIAPGT